MGLVLSRKTKINGVNPEIARKIVKRCFSVGMNMQQLAKELEIAKPTMTLWIMRLTQAGFLRPKYFRGELYWECTEYGCANLVHSRFGAPLSGAKLVDLLHRVVERAAEYNTIDRFPFFIEKISIFGPLLSQPWRNDDPDLAVEVSLKPEMGKIGDWEQDYFGEYGPKRNPTILEPFLFPKNELGRYLVKQQEHINLFQNNVEELSHEWETLFFRGNTENKGEDCLQDAGDEWSLETFEEKLIHYRKKKPARKKRSVSYNEDIASYWNERGLLAELDISKEEAVDSCWRCGSRKDLERCHIIPDSLGGGFEEANIVLLCARCHSEGPNVADERAMIDWLIAYRRSYSVDFWKKKAQKEYEFIYKENVQARVEEILAESGSELSFDEAMQQLQLLVNEAAVDACCHFGQSYFNDATMAALYHVALGQLPQLIRSL